MTRSLRRLILLLSVVLVVLIIVAAGLAAGKDDKPTPTVPSATQPLTQPPTQAPTQAPTQPPTQEPTQEPTVPPTQAPTQPPVQSDMIGSLYTRDQLEAMDKTQLYYSAGSDRDDRGRPTLLLQMNQKYGKYNTVFVAPDDGNIYLTFTCGYEHLGRTGAILDILKEKNVQAVFFVNMHFTKSNPDLIRRILDEGHILANHCSGHPDLPNESIDTIVKEIMDMHDYVLQHYGYKMKLFRPPSGYFSEQVLAIAQSLGYKTVQFSFSYVDWDRDAPVDAPPALNKLIGSAHSGAIYYLHTISATNVAVLPEVIDTLRTQGYNFGLYE